MKDPRRALFAACRQLGLDDDARHALCLDVTGKASTRAFTAADWRRMLDHLNRLTGHTAAGQQRWHAGCDALGAKVTALMADQRLPWRYLTHGAAGRPSMLRRLAGVDRLEFATADGLRAIIAALVRRQSKQP